MGRAGDCDVPQSKTGEGLSSLKLLVSRLPANDLVTQGNGIEWASGERKIDIWTPC
jgi:hypothetical protein